MATDFSEVGANAVVAVQNAIVKLAIDNAGSNRTQRIQSIQNKLSTVQPRTAAVAPKPASRYPAHARMQPKALNPVQSYVPNRLEASINAYFDPPFRSDSYVKSSAYLKPHTTLDYLRSGLEQRIAASASAVEEAVRARSASPSLPNQAGHKFGVRLVSGNVLPPRLQRLQAMEQWTTPHPSQVQSDTAPFSQHRLLAQPPAYQPVLHPITTVPSSPVAPKPLAAPKPCPTKPLPSVDNTAKQPPPPAVCPKPVEASPSSSRSQVLQPSTSAASCAKRTQPNRPTGVAAPDKPPVPVAPTPAPAPLARSRGNKRQRRRPADSSLPKNGAGSATSIANPPNISSSTQPTIPPAQLSKQQVPVIPASSQQSGPSGTPSAKPNLKGRYPNRSARSKRNGAAGPKDTSAPAPVPTPAPVPAPSPAPPPLSFQTNNQPLTSTQETCTAAKGANKKKRYFKKSKPNKPSISTTTGS
jgi:hypothetical protein